MRQVRLTEQTLSCFPHKLDADAINWITNHMEPNRNIILTGFMGTGKSTVGRLLAERLGRRFVDMDAQIEANFGKPVAAIFAEEGEPTFRVAEAQLCHTLAQEQGLVISTGGGALINPHNRVALAATGVIICLTASVEEIVRRVESMNDRPLLAGATNEMQQKIRNLLYQRRQAYAAIAHQVDTNGIEPAAIVDRVLEALAADQEVANMSRINVRHPQGEYHICIGDGLLAHTGALLARRGMRPGPVAVVSNAMIAEYHGAALETGLVAAGYGPTFCIVPEGEQHKTLATVAQIYDQLLAAGLDRRSPVIALGGGVIGDMAGFAAATYLRGVPFVQIPTSLLAMVDASVGGKTGVDLPQGKNLIGAFKQPELVVIDTATLATLPAAEFRSGLAEVVKHGIVGAPELFAQLEEHGPTSMTHLVADAVRVKVAVVQEDPFEQGRRAVLNLGHTFGHALEQVSHYAIRHGEGVAIGLVAASRMAARLEECSQELATRIEKLVDRLGLPTHVAGHDVDSVLAAMGHDKKRAGKTLRFVIPQALGEVIVIDDPGRDVVAEALDSVLH